MISNFYDPMKFFLTAEEQELFVKDNPFKIRCIEWYDGRAMVSWADGSKTYISRALNDDGDDREKILALAYMKKAMGNTGYYNEYMQYWLHHGKTRFERRETKKTESKNSNSNTMSFYDELKNYFTKKEKSCQNCWFSDHGKCTLKDGSCNDKNMWAHDDQDMLDFFSKI